MRKLAALLFVFFSPAWALTVQLPQEITKENMKPIIAEMVKADKTETLTVVSDSYGGDSGAMLDFIELMGKFRHSVAVVNSFAASAAALITASADEVEIKQGAAILFHRAHCASETDTGCVAEIDAYNQDVRTWMSTDFGFKINALDIMFVLHKDFMVVFPSDVTMTSKDLVDVFNNIADSIRAVVPYSAEQERIIVKTSFSQERLNQFKKDLDLMRSKTPEVLWSVYILTGVILS